MATVLTLIVTPPQVGLPSLEPYRHAVLNALKADMATALTVIAQHYPDPPLVLPEPADYNEQVVNSYEIPQVWPYLSVFSLTSANQQPTQQGYSGLWQGQIVVRLFVENSDGNALTLSLERYAAAIWLVIVNADMQNALAGAQVNWGSEEIDPDPSGGTENQRAIEVRFQVWYRV